MYFPFFYFKRSGAFFFIYLFNLNFGFLRLMLVHRRVGINTTNYLFCHRMLFRFGLLDKY